MDRREYLAPICDTLSTTDPEALRNLQPSTSTLKHETVEYRDEEEPSCSNNVYSPDYLESTEYVNYYDSKDDVLGKLKNEFPEDECPHFSGRLVFEDEDILNLIDTQKVKSENTDTLLSLNIREEDADKKQDSLDNTGDISEYNNELVTTEEVKYETNARRTNSITGLRVRRPLTGRGRILTLDGRGGGIVVGSDDDDEGRNQQRVRGISAQFNAIGVQAATNRIPSSAIDMTDITNVGDLPTGTSLEQPLTNKKRRIWNPSIECDGSISPPSRMQVDDEMKFFINNGSEPESDCDDHEEVVPVIIPRTVQVMMDTPQDPEDFVPPVSTSPTTSVTHNDISAYMYQPTNFYDFKWTSFPDSPISPESRRETFSNINVGPTAPYVDPYDAFVAIWDRQFMEYIASETNKYAQELVLQMLNSDTLRASSRLTDWRDTSADELYVYFAILLAMGLVVKSKIEEYWCASSDVFCTPEFHLHMSLKRFQLLNKCLHFNDNKNMCQLNLDASEAKLFKIQPVLLQLNCKFSSMYNLRQNIALDDSLLQWKGWLDINQFIANKAASVGIKTYEICESQTGYLWRFVVHAHKKAGPMSQQLDPLDAHTPAIVLRLIQGLEHKGHTLWMNNFYNSPALARKLKTQGFDCVGTLRTNCQFIPQELRYLTMANMQPGQITGFTSVDVDVMVWRDKNLVGTISTYHGNTTAMTKSTTTLKPTVIHDYNIMMGGVDKKDQMLAMFPIERKRTRIWYKKLFLRLLNVSVLNAFIVVKQSSSSSSSQRSFRIQLIKSLLQNHSNKPTDKTPRERFEIKHHLAEYPFLPNKSKRKRRACVVCKKVVRFYCVGCDMTVCMTPCFLSLHSS